MISRIPLLSMLSVLAMVGLVAPSLAQQQNNAAGGMARGPEDTGAGPRGTPVAPSTNPSVPGHATTPPASTTGVPPRGTPVAPSTKPGAATNQTPQQTR
ncbi:MAG TPA: hypothetical protein VJ779_15450 [Acetobacteraceae bacterium]|nr:hypothetical protein [Acetobacteraceae bacterium]